MRLQFTTEGMAGLDPAMLRLADVSGMELVASIGGDIEPALSPWQLARLGKITGSQFHRIAFGPAGKGWSQGALTYLYEIIGEWLTGRPAHEFSSRATDWGNEWENEAIDRYQRVTRRKVTRGIFYPAKGFKLVGSTPDGVGNIGLEVKCPITPTNHVKTLETQEVPKEYRDQVNGHMLVTGRKRCAFVSYHPKMLREQDKMVIVDVERNEMAIEELTERLSAFEEALIKRLDRLDIDWRNPNYFKQAA